jgi:hypothetical protein
MKREKVELTEEDKLNGWTEDTLRTYLMGREESQMRFIFDNKRKLKRPMTQNHRYNPHKWHG